METQVIEIKTDSVIVYQKGVQITQKGEINLEPGENIVNITNLPESIDKESIRVKGRGKGKIINIDVEFNSKKEFKKEKYQELIEKKKAIQKELEKNENNLSRLREQINKFKSVEDVFYEDFPKAFAFGEVEISKFSEFNSKINDFIEAKQEKVVDIEKSIEELQKDLEVINNKISKLGPLEEVHNFYDITINLDIFEKGKFIFELRFTMYQAWWTPFYDISLTENQAELTMMANVFNRTGLDWEDVSIQISTASLKPVKLIKPDPMILKEYTPQVYRTRRKILPAAAPKMARKMDRADAPTGGMAKEAEEEAIMEEPAPEIEESYADVSENLGVQSFQIPNRLSIPSDKNPHPVNLTKKELESQKAYFWSSAAPENVIIRDNLQNTDLLLLSGNAKVYYLEEFLGETEIPLIAPKEEFKLGTRISYDLKVDKKLIDRSKDKKALRGKLKNYYEYQIKIKNLNEIEENLTIYDRIPHSSSENIDVIIEEINLEPDKKELGVMKWEINMKEVQEKTITYKYYVEYKSGINIRPPLP